MPKEDFLDRTLRSVQEQYETARRLGDRETVLELEERVAELRREINNRRVK